MPSSTDALRQKFMTDTCPDGIETCQDIIKKAGGKINQDFTITPPLNITDEVHDAIEFLCDEWDFAVVQIHRTPEPRCTLLFQP